MPGGCAADGLGGLQIQNQSNHTMNMHQDKYILIIDDDAGVLFVLHDILDRLGEEYHIITARTGPQALEEIKRHPFDLVITDLGLPNINGVELTEVLRTLSLATPVIWITAYDCHRFHSDASRLDVYCCLDKPLEIGTIRKKVQNAMVRAGPESQTGKTSLLDETADTDGEPKWERGNEP